MYGLVCPNPVTPSSSSLTMGTVGALSSSAARELGGVVKMTENFVIRGLSKRMCR